MKVSLFTMTFSRSCCTLCGVYMKLHDGEHSWTIEVALRMLVEWMACVSLDIVSRSQSYGLFMVVP